METTLPASASLLRATGSGPLRGQARAPGDKSISHRALILGAMATGETRIEGLLESADVLATARAVEQMGARLEHRGPGAWTVFGLGRLDAPTAPLDCGNSGTGCRLLMGAVAGYPIQAIFDGDASLRGRPMGRVITPLAAMGARFESGRDRLPLSLTGGGLAGIDYQPPIASAQVKSAVLLAGVNAAGATSVIESSPTRDHTERMLKAFGAAVSVIDTPEGRVASIQPGPLGAVALTVPGDPSSAAFPLVAAVIVPGSRVTVTGVLLNPSRIGLLQTLREMGADIQVTGVRSEGGEDVGDVTASHSSLRGVVVPPERAPSMIDEYPILAVAAAFARGETVMRGLAELRVKESDRIALMAAGLKACGVDVEEEPEGFIVRGDGEPPRGGCSVATHGDHRIAMAHLVLGLAAREGVLVDEARMIGTSFPGFADLMRGLGAVIETA